MPGCDGIGLTGELSSRGDQRIVVAARQWEQLSRGSLRTLEKEREVQGYFMSIVKCYINDRLKIAMSYPAMLSDSAVIFYEVSIFRWL